jgi:hypothetical protein
MKRKTGVLALALLLVVAQRQAIAGEKIMPRQEIT